MSYQDRGRGRDRGPGDFGQRGRGGYHPSQTHHPQNADYNSEYRNPPYQFPLQDPVLSSRNIPPSYPTSHNPDHSDLSLNARQAPFVDPPNYRQYIQPQVPNFQTRVNSPNPHEYHHSVRHTVEESYLRDERYANTQQHGGGYHHSPSYDIRHEDRMNISPPPSYQRDNSRHNHYQSNFTRFETERNPDRHRTPNDFVRDRNPDHHRTPDDFVRDRKPDCRQTPDGLFRERCSDRQNTPDSIAQEGITGHQQHLHNSTSQEYKRQGRKMLEVKPKNRPGHNKIDKTDQPRVFSPDNSAKCQSDNLRENCHGRSLPQEKKQFLGNNNKNSTPKESSQVPRDVLNVTSREKVNKNKKTRGPVQNPHDSTSNITDGQSEITGAKIKDDFNQQRPKNLPLERQLSNISLAESEKSTASEMSATRKDKRRQQNSKAGLPGKRNFNQINKEKFKSMPDLKHHENIDERRSPAEIENKMTGNSLPSADHLTNDGGTIDKPHRNSHKRKQSRGTSKKTAGNPQQENLKHEQVNESISPIHRMKVNLQIYNPFSDAAALKGIIIQNIDANDRLQFVNEPIIGNDNGSPSSCTMIIETSSKNQGKQLLKNLCARLKKKLDKKVFYTMCTLEDEVNLENKNPTDSERQVKTAIYTSKNYQKGKPFPKAPSTNSIRKMLEVGNLEGEEKSPIEDKKLKNFLGEKQEDGNVKHPVEIPTKISVTVDKFIPNADDLIKLLSQIECNTSFNLVPNSFVNEASRTQCELIVPSKAASKKVVKEFNSSRLEDMHIKSSVVNSKLPTHEDCKSKAEPLEIQKAIDQIIKKTQKCLDEHQQKIIRYEEALILMKSSTHSDDDDSDMIEERVLFELEVAKQRDSFCSRRDELIEKVKKLEILTPNTRELSDLLQSVGVECQRLKAALPIYARREDIVTKVSQNQVSIILGETGSGKSTQMTQYLYEAGLAGDGLIVCTQPRKVAAITLAERVAKEMAGKVGGLVGYKSGLNKKMSPMTKIIFATDHCLLNECLGDSNLSRYNCIIVDEAHERSIYTDLLLGMIKACLAKRPDLRVIITSATISPDIFIKYFNTSKELRVSGRTFPVETLYAEINTTQEFENFEIKAVQKAVDVHKNEEPGHILVFLTSAVEIMRCCAEFDRLMAGRKDFKCFPLHGQLPPEEQKRVFERPDQGIRKIVFATNCAETSITIDGIKYVIDSGVAKEMQYDSKRNICMLGTYVISKSSANQRKGRAGRTGSGKCYRLYTEEGYNTMQDSTKPEILKVPLAQSVLKLAELGVEVKKYDFVESPSTEAIDTALSTLKDLGALSAEGGITDIGRWISKLPFNPKEGFIVYHGNKANLLYDSVVLAALISNGSNLFYRGLTESEALSSASSKIQFGSPHGDVFAWLDVYKAWTNIPANRQSKWCKENAINYKVMSFTKQCVKEVASILNNEFKIQLEYKFSSDESAALLLRKIIFDANMASVCYYLGHVRAGYQALVAERQVHVHPSSILLPHNLQSEWIVYTEFTKTSRDYIKGITVVEEEWVLDAVNEGKLNVDINLAKQRRIELVHSEIVGPVVFRKLVGARYSQLRVWEDKLTNAGMKAVVVEADFEFGRIDIFSSLPMNPVIAEHIAAAKREVIENLNSDEAELDIFKKTGTEPSGVRVVIGQGGCVKSLLMPDQSNKILIKKPGCDITEEDIKAKFGVYGNIKECVRFKRSDPWGFIRYSSFTEAQAAVNNTRTDTENIAVLKIDSQFKKKISKFVARLSWCRRPVKGKGTAFIKCPPIERASLIGRVIVLSVGQRELKVSNKGDDLVCFNTGSAQEIEIKREVMNILEYDESSIQNIHVNVIREHVEIPSKKDQDSLKERISKCVSHYVAKDKFNLQLKSVKVNDVNQVGFLHFESPTDGFQAYTKLVGELYENGQFIEISPTLKTTLFVSASIMNVCKNRFTDIIKDLKEYKETEVHIRQMNQGDFAFEIKSEKIKSMVEARELLQKELEGDIIKCNANELLRQLLKRQGKEALKKIESQLEVLIVINDRREQVHIYGTMENVSQAMSKINNYLGKLAEGKQVDVFLREQGRPPGLMKGLMNKYANLHDDLIQQFALTDVTIDFKQQKLSIFGPEKCVDKALSSISELESSLSKSGIPHAEKVMPDCAVCLCPIESYSEMHRLEACGHAYCHQCLKNQITVCEQEKHFPAVCAQNGCEIPLVWKDLSFCVKKQWITEEKLVDKSTSAFVASDPGRFKFCLTPECPVVYEATKNEEGVEFYCPSCYLSQCTSCHTAFHVGLTCKMSTTEEKAEQLFKEWVAENPDQRKNCPKCKVVVEKIAGCNKMICKSCHICFCWLCLEIFADSQKCYAHLVKKHGGFN